MFRLFSKMFFGSFCPILFYVLGYLFLTFYAVLFMFSDLTVSYFLMFLGFLIKVTNFYLFRRKGDSFIIFFHFFVHP